MRRRLTIGMIAGRIVIWTAVWGVVSVAAWASPSREFAPRSGIAILADLIALPGGATVVVVLLLALPVRRSRPVCDAGVSRNRTACANRGHELGTAAWGVIRTWSRCRGEIRHARRRTVAQWGRCANCRPQVSISPMLVR